MRLFDSIVAIARRVLDLEGQLDESRRTNARLQERIRHLERTLDLPATGKSNPLHLPGLMLPMLQLLMVRETVTREMFEKVMYPPGATLPKPKTIDVHLVKLRHRLAYEHGVKLMNDWGIGWSLSAADKEKLRNVLAGTSTKAAQPAAGRYDAHVPSVASEQAGPQEAVRGGGQGDRKAHQGATPRA